MPTKLEEVKIKRTYEILKNLLNMRLELHYIENDLYNRQKEIEEEDENAINKYEMRKLEKNKEEILQKMQNILIRIDVK